MAGIPVKFSVTPASVRMPPPLLGEHNGEILKSWLGMSDEADRRAQKREDPMTGKTFEEFHAGDRYSTGRRTITEHDILQFVTLVGLTEPLFLDMEYIRNESLLRRAHRAGKPDLRHGRRIDGADRDSFTAPAWPLPASTKCAFSVRSK